MDQEQRVTADVQIDRINPYVDLPANVVEALAGGRRAAVLVRVMSLRPAGSASETTYPNLPAADEARLQAIGRLARGGWFRTTLVPRRTGATRLYLDTWMRAAAGAGVGDRVQVILKPDHDSRELPLPVPLSVALQANPGAQAAWDRLALSRRREILTYLNFLKTPAALARNVAKIIGELLDQK